MKEPTGKLRERAQKKIQKATSLLSLLKAREVSLKRIEYTTNTCFLLRAALTVKKKYGNDICEGLKAIIQTDWLSHGVWSF